MIIIVIKKQHNFSHLSNNFLHVTMLLNFHFLRFVRYIPNHLHLRMAF